MKVCWAINICGINKTAFKMVEIIFDSKLKINLDQKTWNFKGTENKNKRQKTRSFMLIIKEKPFFTAEKLIFRSTSLIVSRNDNSKNFIVESFWNFSDKTNWKKFFGTKGVRFFLIQGDSRVVRVFVLTVEINSSWTCDWWIAAKQKKKL